MPRSKKIFVIFMFSLGFLCVEPIIRWCVSLYSSADAKVRTVSIMAWRIQSTVRQQRSSDFIYDYYDIALQSHLEIWLGIIAATLPTLAPIVSRLIAPAFSLLVSSYRKHLKPIYDRASSSQRPDGYDGHIPLPKVGFSRLGEESMGFGSVSRWRVGESLRKDEDSTAGIFRQARSVEPEVTTRGHHSDMLVEPHDQV